jgi:hypothetical protein
MNLLDQSRQKFKLAPSQHVCREVTPSFPDQRFASAVAAAEFARSHAAIESRSAGARASGAKIFRAIDINALKKGLAAGPRYRADAGRRLRRRIDRNGGKQ